MIGDRLGRMHRFRFQREHRRCAEGLEARDQGEEQLLQFFRMPPSATMWLTLSRTTRLIFFSRILSDKIARNWLASVSCRER